MTLPPFQGYPVFLAKFLVPPPHVAQVLEGPTPYPQPLPFNKGGGGLQLYDLMS